MLQRYLQANRFSLPKLFKRTLITLKLLIIDVAEDVVDVVFADVAGVIGVEESDGFVVGCIMANGTQDSNGLAIGPFGQDLCSLAFRQPTLRVDRGHLSIKSMALT